ncbi:hypothetical protein [Halosolutus gelatinilyticus]|uniref:hypothetical protein n=1 Tax=Halosolutus gelatinilyticus TaxID=2931975 RepID=UPI001FF43905|nr:hypothetical protein [Halosolutus gelatinilyticus]
MTERPTLDRTERLTLAVFVAFLATLAIVAIVDEPIGWLLWSAATIVLVGAVLIAVNRVSSAE